MWGYTNDNGVIVIKKTQTDTDYVLVDNDHDRHFDQTIVVHGGNDIIPGHLTQSWFEPDGLQWQTRGPLARWPNNTSGSAWQRIKKAPVRGLFHLAIRILRR
jgi:hypothetical protein